jgi:hypothetical protein
LCVVSYLCIVHIHLCRHPRVFIRRTARVLASQNLVGYESQKSAREIRNRFKMARGSRRGAIGFIQPSSEIGEPIHGKRTALPPVTEEPIKVNDPLFTAVTVRPRPNSNQLFHPRPERADRLFTRSAKRSRTPARVGPGFWRTIHAHVACARPSPEAQARPGEARRASARVCSSFFLSPTLARAWRASNYLS